MQLMTLLCQQPSQDTNGYLQPLSLAKVYVYITGTTTTVQLYDASSNPISNPMTADTNGYARIATADGTYDIKIVSADGSYTAPILEEVQFLDISSLGNISGLSSLSSFGLVFYVSANTYLSRSLVAPAAGFTITNPAGIAGNPTFALANDLAAIEALSGTGIAVRTAANTWANRIMLSPNPGLAIANPDGVAGSPTFNLADDLAAIEALSGTNIIPVRTGADTWAGIDSVMLTQISTLSPLDNDILQHKSGAWANRTLAQFVADLLGTASFTRPNYMGNSGFDIWQDGTGPITPAASTKVYIADLWFAIRAQGGSSFSRAAGFNGGQYCLQMGRAAGNSQTGSIRVFHQIGAAMAMLLASKSVTLSFDVVAGADYSGGSTFNVRLFTGTGTDEPFDLIGLTFTSATTQTSFASLTPGAATRYSSTITVPAGATEGGVELQYSPTGTAGSNDWVKIGNIKLEQGATATPYERESTVIELARCQRQYRKTFLLATAPAQNAGAGTGEFRSTASKAGAAVQSLGTVMFGLPMRAAPTVTPFNPAAANGQARDITAGADCSSTTVDNITESSCELFTTGNASTAVGNTLGVHLKFDARL